MFLRPASPLVVTGLALAAGALMLAAYAQGGVFWPLGFVALVPWLVLLSRAATLGRTLLLAWVMTLLLVLAGYYWFGFAIARFTGSGPVAGMAVLLLAAPLLQPQLMAFAMTRHVVGRHRGALAGVLAGAAVWVGVEWAVLKPLGDTLAHGLYPALRLRQSADLVGTAGLTLMLLLANEAWLALATGHTARRTRGRRAVLVPQVVALVFALLLPLLLATYGHAALSRALPAGAPPLRIGLVQANLTDLEERRRSQGSYEAVRELLDLHFAMSYDAIERQRADAVLWSETIYPTTFGQPKSEAGAALDNDIRAFVDAARVPFVFGTYERDALGEYNAAALVEPGRGLLAHYRKTRLFPLTESVPAWLDGPVLRRALPWAGNWQPGSGARVLPLRLRDGREVPVQVLICRDDVDPGLAIDAARQGAQALLTLSNDAWFSDHPIGARLHQAAAAFRSIETRLPQFRVTTNGYSAAIDATGEVRAGALMNERSLVMGELPVPVPPRTLMVAWGDWVGPAALAALGLLLAGPPLVRWLAREGHAPVLPMHVVLLPPAARVAGGALRAIARLGLLGLGLALLFDDDLRGRTLAQLRWTGALVLAPELAALCLLAAFRSRVSLTPGLLTLTRGAQRLELPLASLVAVRAWRWPWPSAGLSLRLADGAAYPLGLALRHADALARALAAAGGPAAEVGSAYAQAQGGVARGRWAHPLLKFGLLPLVLAVPAFHLHQHIAYGSGVGEYLTFGLAAYFQAFVLWWAAWSVGVLLAATALRGVVEAVAWLAARWQPGLALAWRRGLERGATGLLWLGLPAWLALRLVVSAG